MCVSVYAYMTVVVIYAMKKYVCLFHTKSLYSIMISRLSRVTTGNRTFFVTTVPCLCFPSQFLSVPSVCSQCASYNAACFTHTLSCC